MRFVKTEKLEKGMRIAVPIYNRNGVLLYDRNTLLTKQGISSVKNFNLLGIYILEAVEPLPPITEEGLEFEKFQTMSVFGLREDIELLIRDKMPLNLFKLSQMIVKKYGDKDKSLNFYQNLRSKEDYVYKHSLSTSIMAAMMGAKFELSKEIIEEIVVAALIHDIGKTMIPNDLLNKFDLTDKDRAHIDSYELKGYNLIQSSMNISEEVKIITEYKYNFQMKKKFIKGSDKLMKAAQILHVADTFDTITSMTITKEPESEVVAIRHLLNPENEFEMDCVSALVDSMKILYPGICIELTNNIKGLVIRGNEENALKPIILGFNDNQVYNLNVDRVYSSVQIKDIMKTLDNRIKIDQKTIDEYMRRYSGKIIKED